jgi:hypothetical protein
MQQQISRMQVLAGLTAQLTGGLLLRANPTETMV